MLHDMDVHKETNILGTVKENYWNMLSRKLLTATAES